MSDDYQLYRFPVDNEKGIIETIAVWSVWDCVAQRWTNKPKVTLRNTLLSGLHPNVNNKDRFCIGEIPESTKDSALLNPFQPNKDDRYILDLASNSRNHGRFTFNLKPIGRDYYGNKATEQWKRIIYGSILHTGCKHLVFGNFNYVIVDDDARDEQGNPQDDPTNGRHWNTGDSHGKASRQFMELLGAAEIFDQDFSPEDDINLPLQFRIAQFKDWVAKGTIAYNSELDNSGFDLVIPWSSLKGNKPALGNYEGKLLCGLVFEGELRRAKAGWMLFQWFDYATLEQDRIISRLVTKCQRLAAALNSIQELANLLRIDQTEAEQEIQEGVDNLQSEAEYVNTAMEIIKYDVRGKLLLHPYITGKVKERLRAVWLNLAKAAGVRFWSLMAQPDEYFAKNESIDNNGKTVFSRKEFCAPGMSEGEYILFCNPMRHWGDCQLWINVHEGLYADSKNLMAASRKLLLSLGRDTDGDFIQLIASREYPELRRAIANFSTPPSVRKLPKVPLVGNLQQVAVNSMNDQTGIVASLLGRVRGAGAEGIVLNIPAGGMQTLPQEMAIIDFLSQELQIAVDSLKSAYPNNDVGLKAVATYLDGLGDAGQIPWLKGFKAESTYLTQPCPVAPNAIDTVSRLVQLVNSYWQPAQIETNLNINSFRESLFPGVTVSLEQQNYAFEQKKLYGIEIGAAIEWKLANEGDTTRIREVTAKYQALRDSILDRVLKPDGTQYSLKSWSAAFWRAANTVNIENNPDSTGSIVFNLFREEIILELKENPEPPWFFQVYNVHKMEPNHRAKVFWSGQTVQVRVVLRDWAAPRTGVIVPTLSADLLYPPSTQLPGFYPLGLVAEQDRSKIAIGETRTMKIYTWREQRPGQVTEFSTTKAWLFNEDVPQQLIDDVLGKGRTSTGLYKPEDFGYTP
ncbi:hypothetical protein [Microcoleus sp. bin38.metabat.b11b12b14.051]|uniref:hypothetical protein n=1 Tax=Microcoleus sp. bin38.metabat.b11b12b14.051 TaxID=2742709 RepID=UPI0025DA2D02|nr:hypothetical protein [Microcoleus sp. bin38.metabat.b11b12b14.051]